MEQIDDKLKDQFIYGIADDKLRKKVNMKLNKVTDILKNKMTMQELIKYAKVAENSIQTEGNKKRPRSYRDIWHKFGSRSNRISK